VGRHFFPGRHFFWVDHYESTLILGRLFRSTLFLGRPFLGRLFLLGRHFGSTIFLGRLLRVESNRRLSGRQRTLLTLQEIATILKTPHKFAYNAAFLNAGKSIYLNRATNLTVTTWSFIYFLIFQFS